MGEVERPLGLVSGDRNCGLNLPATPVWHWAIDVTSLSLGFFILKIM